MKIQTAAAASACVVKLIITTGGGSKLSHLGLVRFQFAIGALLLLNWLAASAQAKDAKDAKENANFFFSFFCGPKSSSSQWHQSVSSRLSCDALSWFSQISFSPWCQSMFRVSWHRNKLYSSHGAFSLPSFPHSALSLSESACRIAEFEWEKKGRERAPTLLIWVGKTRLNSGSFFPPHPLSLSSVSRRSIFSLLLFGGFRVGC